MIEVKVALLNLTEKKDSIMNWAKFGEVYLFSFGHDPGRDRINGPRRRSRAATRCSKKVY